VADADTEDLSFLKKHAAPISIGSVGTLRAALGANR
jgi:hypothetical protein